MKILRILFLTLCAVIIISIIGLVVFVKTFDANKYKEHIAQKISETTGYRLAIGSLDLKLSVKKGVTLDAGNIEVKDDLNFSNQNLLEVENVFVNVNVIKFIQSREISVSRIVLRKPKLYIVKNQDAELNILNMPAKPAGIASSSSEPEKESSKEQPSKNSSAQNQIDVGLVVVSRGEVIYLDKSLETEAGISIKDIDIEVSNFSFDKLFSYKLSCSVFSSSPNIYLKGDGIVSQKTGQVRLDDIVFETDLADMAYTQITSVVPSADLSSISDLKGKIKIDVSRASIEGNKYTFSAVGKISEVQVKLKDFLYPIENISSEFEVDESNIRVKDFSAQFVSGQINLKADIVDYLKAQDIALQINADGLDVEQLAVLYDLPFKVTGKLKLDVSDNLKIDPNQDVNKDLLSNLSAKGSLELVDGKLEDVNILRIVLSKFSFLPNLVQKVHDKLPPQYQERLNEDDTDFGETVIDFYIENQAVLLSRVHIDAQDAIVSAKGKLDFNQNLALNMDILIPEEISAYIIEAASELEGMVNSSGQLRIPFKSYDGTLANFKPIPDVSDIGQSVIRQTGKNELRKLIFKELDINQQSDGAQSPESEAQTDEQNTNPQPKPQPSAEEVLIDNVLNSIFK